MTPKTQSVCKHCPFEIYFSDFYKSWLHKKVVAETLHVAEPVAEPASTGEPKSELTHDPGCSAILYEPGVHCKCEAARPSEPSAPQSVCAMKLCGGWESHPIHRNKAMGNYHPFLAPNPSAPQRSAEPYVSYEQVVLDQRTKEVGYIAAPQPVSGDAPGDFTEAELVAIERSSFDGSQLWRLARQLRERTAERDAYDIQRKYLLEKLAAPAPSPAPSVSAAAKDFWTEYYKSDPNFPPSEAACDFAEAYFKYRSLAAAPEIAHAINDKQHDMNRSLYLVELVLLLREFCSVAQSTPQAQGTPEPPKVEEVVAEIERRHFPNIEAMPNVAAMKTRLLMIVEDVLAILRPYLLPASQTPHWVEEFIEHIKWMHDHAHNRIEQTHDSGVIKGCRCIPWDSQLNAYLQGQRDTATELLARAREFKKLATPASTARTDEWVSVRDRLPATSGIYEVIIAHAGKEEYRDGAVYDPTLEEEWTFSSDPHHGMIDLEVSRWREFGPLPAAPGSVPQAASGWTVDEAESFKRLASEPQPKPTEHLIRAMGVPQAEPPK